MRTRKSELKNLNKHKTSMRTCARRDTSARPNATNKERKETPKSRLFSKLRLIISTQERKIMAALPSISSPVSMSRTKEDKSFSNKTMQLTFADCTGLRICKLKEMAVSTF